MKNAQTTIFTSIAPWFTVEAMIVLAAGIAAMLINPSLVTLPVVAAAWFATVLITAARDEDAAKRDGSATA